MHLKFQIILYIDVLECVAYTSSLCKQPYCHIEKEDTFSVRHDLMGDFRHTCISKYLFSGHSCMHFHVQVQTCFYDNFLLSSWVAVFLSLLCCLMIFIYQALIISSLQWKNKLNLKCLQTAHCTSTPHKHINYFPFMHFTCYTRE